MTLLIIHIALVALAAFAALQAHRHAVQAKVFADSAREYWESVKSVAVSLLDLRAAEQRKGSNPPPPPIARRPPAPPNPPPAPAPVFIGGEDVELIRQKLRTLDAAMGGDGESVLSEVIDAAIQAVQAPAPGAERPTGPIDVSFAASWTDAEKIGFIEHCLRWPACGYVNSPERIESIRLAWKIASDLEKRATQAPAVATIADVVRALRLKSNSLPRYSFFLSDPPGVKRALSVSGNWVERDAVSQLLDETCTDWLNKALGVDPDDVGARVHSQGSQS